eukprot:SAG31_NODE_309_length_17949_cov_11.083361_1_plen_72_part_00
MRDLLCSHFEMDDATVTVKTDAIIAQELYSFEGFDGSFDWAGMNRNVAADPANTKVVQSLHQKILEYIRLY